MSSIDPSRCNDPRYAMVCHGLREACSVIPDEFDFGEKITAVAVFVEAGGSLLDGLVKAYADDANMPDIPDFSEHLRARACGWLQAVDDDLRISCVVLGEMLSSYLENTRRMDYLIRDEHPRLLRSLIATAEAERVVACDNLAAAASQFTALSADGSEEDLVIDAGAEQNRAAGEAIKFTHVTDWLRPRLIAAEQQAETHGGLPSDFIEPDLD